MLILLPIFFAWHSPTHNHINFPCLHNYLMALPSLRKFVLKLLHVGQLLPLKVLDQD
jgi:hypothetical protein